MAPSKDTCLLCSCPFFGKQQFFRCEKCEKRVHAKCVTWPDDELDLLKSGSRSFCCNLCELNQQGVKPSDNDPTACSPQLSLSQTGSPFSSCAPPGDLDGSLAGLRRLLLDALEGISFLSEEVSQLREENERLRKDHSRGVEQQTQVVASLRAEVRCLRDELSRRATAMPVKTPADSGKSPTLTTSTPASTRANVPVLQRTAERRDAVSPRDFASSTEKAPETTQKNKKTSALSVAQRQHRPKAIFVSNLSSETTSSDLTNHLKALNISPLSCRRLRTKYQSYSSFHVAVDEEALKRLNDPSMWPMGCLFKPFRGVLHDDMIHATEITTPKDQSGV